MATGIFVFVSAVTLVTTAGILLLMWRDPRAGLKKLDHQEDALPEVMTGRYLTFFVLTVMAVAHGDILVMAGLQLAFVVASVADVIIYARRGERFLPHLLAAIAASVAVALCGFVVLTS
ncbi:MAG: hypothetical protein AAGA15_06155 [Pseudomonadota bacterium]